MNKTRILNIISLPINVAIIVLVIFGIIKGINSGILVSDIFKYFETLVAVFAALASFAMIFANIRNLKKGQDVTPRFCASLRFVAATLSLVVILIDAIIIAPKSGNDYFLNLENGNIFIRLISPIMCCALFLFVEVEHKFRFRKTFTSFILVLLYSAAMAVTGVIIAFIKNPETAIAFLPKEYFFFLVTPKLSTAYTTNIIYTVAIVVGSFVVAALLYILNRVCRSLYGVRKEITTSMPNSTPTLSAPTTTIVEKETASVAPTTKVEPQPVINDTSSTSIKEEIKPIKEPVETSKKEIVTNNEEATTSNENMEWKTIDPTSLNNETVATSAPKKKASSKSSTPKIDFSRVYHISIHDRARKTWKIKLAGGKKALKIFPTQKEAIDYANELIKKTGGSIRVHTTGGKMRKK